MDVVLFSGPRKSKAVFGPGSISGLFAWYAIRKQTGFNDGDDVTTFVDQSGNGRDLTQATDSRKPHYRITTRNIGGVPALEYVPASFQFHTAAWGAVLSAPFTVFVVCHPDRTQSNETIFDDYNLVNNFRLLRENGTSNNVQFTDTGLTSAAGEYIAADMLLTAVVQSGANALRKNGVEIDTSITTISATLDGVIIGGRSDTLSGTMFDGLIAEVIFYDRVLSPAEVNQVEAFLMTLYGI